MLHINYIANAHMLHQEEIDRIPFLLMAAEVLSKILPSNQWQQERSSILVPNQLFLQILHLRNKTFTPS